MDLGSPGALPDGERIHPVEMYVMPPLEGHEPQVGDLLQSDGADIAAGWWLVLTPSCDLANRKAEHVLLAPALPFEDHPDVKAWRLNRSNKRREKVSELVRQATDGQRDRWIFLPGALDVPDLIVDLQQLRAFPRTSLDGLKTIASLDSPFAEAAVNRFGRYFGRVGTPDLDAEALLKAFEAQAPAATEPVPGGSDGS